MRRRALLTSFAAALLMVGQPAASESPISRPIAVIVGASQTVALRKSDLELVFRRKKLFWQSNLKVVPVNLPATSQLRKDFSQAVLNASPEDLEKYWNDMYFHGVGPPYVLTSEEAVIRFVAQTPGAIGYVSTCAVDVRVRVVLVITTQGTITDNVSAAKCAR